MFRQPRSVYVRTCGIACLLALAAALWLQARPQDRSKPAGEWPLARGNLNQNGVAETSLPDKLEVVWTFKAKDAFEEAAAIVDGVVYAGCYDEHLYALDLKDGKEKW